MSRIIFFLYSMSHYLSGRKVPILPNLITLLIYVFFNSYVPATCKIGKGTRFAYGGIGIVIHARAVIGKNCIIGQGITIGGRSKLIDVPIIGDNVQISAGARILGNIEIGDNVVIGANAVVINSVQPNSVVAGVPAKVIKEHINIEDYK